MKFRTKATLATAALAAFVACGSAKAAPIVGLTIEVSTTGTVGSYSDTVPTNLSPGNLYYEVVAQFATTGTTNTNTGTKTPNGSTDSIVTLPNVTLAVDSGSTFQSSTLENNFGTASSAVAGTPGSSTLTFRAGETGYTEYADSPLVLDQGTLTIDSAFTGITGSEQGVNGGSIRIAGSPSSISTATETSDDPIVGITNAAEPAVSAVPAPSIPVSAAALVGIGGLVTLARRRGNLA